MPTKSQTRVAPDSTRLPAFSYTHTCAIFLSSTLLPSTHRLPPAPPPPPSNIGLASLFFSSGVKSWISLVSPSESPSGRFEKSSERVDILAPGSRNTTKEVAGNKSRHLLDFVTSLCRVVTSFLRWQCWTVDLLDPVAIVFACISSFAAPAPRSTFVELGLLRCTLLQHLGTVHQVSQILCPAMQPQNNRPSTANVAIQAPGA